MATKPRAVAQRRLRRVVGGTSVRPRTGFEIHEIERKKNAKRHPKEQPIAPRKRYQEEGDHQSLRPISCVRGEDINAGEGD